MHKFWFSLQNAESEEWLNRDCGWRVEEDGLTINQSNDKSTDEEFRATDNVATDGGDFEKHGKCKVSYTVRGYEERTNNCVGYGASAWDGRRSYVLKDGAESPSILE